jgi:surfeit locus 1 family protein
MTRAKRRASDVVVALAVLVLVGLGTWQLERRDWKDALIAEREALYAAPPIASWHEAKEYRRARLEGRFLEGRALTVGFARPIAALALDDGTVALVEAATRPAGRVAVEGILRADEQGGWAVPANDAARGRWMTVETAAMSRALGLADVRPFWLQTSPLPELRNEHMGYAITWYSLGVALVVIYAIARRRLAVR